MFESIVTTVLNKVLGEFIDDVSSKQLNIGLWSGQSKGDLTPPLAPPFTP